ncbi:DUF1109 domain-containing protein [Hyalangium rubrum]|uniref:DUF1109 domain-containing protein n=1 Tax=Hyalangium rubrum TaxID=3103134 RepID=A0ABU5HC21_9BACT|nr:DUF1109 domain-containing protein [Hyalangium sp. s54d21]MDY7230383.1 DUF1109 domain-containing protein [Hyalangium sp. s54d21]
MQPSSVDTLLLREPPANGAALERALTAARGELALKRPVRRWRTQAVWVVASSVAMVGSVAAVLLAVEQLTLSDLLGRAHLFALLWVTGAVCAWSSLSPRGRGLRRVGVLLAMVSAATLVFSRGAAASAPSLPPWVCTVSHLGVAIGPLIVSVLALRAAAFHPLRALVAGLAVGTTGALMGELACAQDWRHVAGYHLSAWALVALVELAVSKFLKPRSFAP